MGTVWVLEMGTQVVGECKLGIIGSNPLKKFAVLRVKILSITWFLMVWAVRMYNITGNISQNPFDKITVFKIDFRWVIKAKFYVDICSNYFQKQR